MAFYIGDFALPSLLLHQLERGDFLESNRVAKPLGTPPDHPKPFGGQVHPQNTYVREMKGDNFWP